MSAPPPPYPAEGFNPQANQPYPNKGGPLPVGLYRSVGNTSQKCIGYLHSVMIYYMRVCMSMSMCVCYSLYFYLAFQQFRIIYMYSCHYNN